MKPEHRAALDKARAAVRRAAQAMAAFVRRIAGWRPSAGQREAARRTADRFLIVLQGFVPTLALSSLMFRIARIKSPAFKNWLIGFVVKAYKVNLAEAEFERIANYTDFNHFFTRALKPNARTLDPDPKMLVSPVDGRVSQLGAIRNWSLVQAKGADYTVEELIGSHGTARMFHHGSFCTIYLAPHNYHRIHMPANGKLREWSYFPGKLFSVSAANVSRMPKLFVNNERVCAVFDSDFGPLAIVMVGALFVGSIQTTWSGLITPPHGQKAGVYQPMSPVILLRGRELGRFNMGSTVIILAGPGMVQWRPHLEPGKEVRMGLSLGTLSRRR